MRRFLANLFLLVVSPVISELLLGSTPIHTAFYFPILVGSYGAGALLIHEVKVRRGLHWLQTILLAIAFACILEGIVFQTIFNPHFAGYLDVYGRALGVNWYWAEYIIGWHAIWTVCVPIILTELLFPEYQHQPLLKRGGLIVDAISCVLFCGLLCFIYIVYQKFTASPVLLVSMAVLVVLLIVLAFLLPVRSPMSQARINTGNTGVSLWLVGLFCFLLSLYWFGIHEIISTTFPIPALLLNIIGVVLVAVTALLLNLWSTGYVQRSEAYLLSIVSGALPAGALMGAIIVNDGIIVDTIAQAALGVIVIAFLIILHRRVNTRHGAEETSHTQETLAHR